jgi:hypothetical protein
VSAALLMTAWLAAAPAAPAADLEPARDALRRHDYARAAGLLAPLAEAGHAEAEYQLALLYLPRTNDVGLPPDAPRACRLLVAAASAAHAKAAYALAAQVEGGTCPDTGHSAAEWSSLATGAGHGGARGRTETAAVASADPATLLKRAARDGDLAELGRLLAKSPATLTGPDQRTALHEAADGAKPEAAALLLQRGAQVDARDGGGDTPLLVAARRGAAPVIEVLLGAKADANARDARGGTPLMLAVAAQSQPSAELLLAHGADATLRNAQGLSPSAPATARPRARSRRCSRATARPGSRAPASCARRAATTSSPGGRR